MLVVVFSPTGHKIASFGDSLTFDGGSKTIATPVLDVALVGLLFKRDWLTGFVEEEDEERRDRTFWLRCGCWWRGALCRLDLNLSYS
jgi:hypothetical protein